MGRRIGGRIPLLATLALVAAADCKRSQEPSAGDAARAPAAPLTVEDVPAPGPADAGSVAVVEMPVVTPNDFYARGTPTLVLGTGGNDRADRVVAGQARLVAGMVFPDAPILEDVEIDVARGVEAWPARPLVYGGPHVNELLARIGPTLPFLMGVDGLALGGRVFEGPGIRLIAVVPARAADEVGPGYPEFLLYAGTGPLGVAEINAVAHGDEPLLVADAFGRLQSGRWKRASSGEIVADLGPGERRIEWREVVRSLPGAGGGGGAKASFRFPAMVPQSDDEPELIEAGMRGLGAVVERLALAAPEPLDLYVYPDRRSKQELTGNGGDGHAVPAALALHILAGDASEGGVIEVMVGHEATHLLATAAWGPPGTPLLGEGLAVWVSGAYGGVTLEEWRERPAERPAIEVLLGGFRKLPEAESYPAAGLLVAAAVEAIGIEGVRAHLYGAAPSEWAEACAGAGLDPATLEPTE